MRDVLVLNFSHPITDEQVTQITAQFIGGADVRVVDFSVHLDLALPLHEQVMEITERAELVIEDARAKDPTSDIVVNLPGYSLAAAMVAKSLCFDYYLRLRRVEDALPPRYEVAELIPAWWRLNYG